MGFLDRFISRYRPAWVSGLSTVVAVERVRASSPVVETFVPDGYRGTMRADPPASTPTRDIECITFTTEDEDESSSIRNVFFDAGVASVGWSVEVHRWCVAERLFARRGDMLLVPQPLSGLQAISLVDGRTLWREDCGSTLAMPPRLLDDGSVRCGLNDGSVIDVDLRELRTLSRFDPTERPGSVRAGRSLEVIDFARQREVWLESVHFEVRDGDLWGRGKVGRCPPGYEVAAPIFVDGQSIVAWLTHYNGSIAIAFFDGKTLGLEDCVELGGADDGQCLGAYVVDSFLCARVAAQKVATILVDLRTRTLAGVLHDWTSDKSGVLGASGETIYRGPV